MRKFLTSVMALAALGAAGFYLLTVPAQFVGPVPGPGDAEKGALVFAAGGCASCHAAPRAEDDARRLLLGGLELATPFGTFVAPNISSDPVSGIGGWTDADFLSAMLHGTSPDGRHYYPAFPYASYARMDPTDVVDLHAYLKTLPASDHDPGGHKLGFPFNLRRGLGLWKRLHLSPAPVLPATEDPVLARGQYLVEGPGHCGACHTPRDATGGVRLDAWLAGGPSPDGPGKIPNITPHETGLSWSQADIAYYLESGFTPEFDAAGGQMASVIKNTALLPASDRAAMAKYLKSIPPVASEN